LSTLRKEEGGEKGKDEKGKKRKKKGEGVFFLSF